MGWPGPMTDRQFQAWQAWLKADWNRPSRADHYAMQVASCMGGKQVKPLKFTFDESKPRMSDQEAEFWTLTRWGIAAGRFPENMPKYPGSNGT